MVSAIVVWRRSCFRNGGLGIDLCKACSNVLCLIHLLQTEFYVVPHSGWCSMGTSFPFPYPNSLCLYDAGGTTKSHPVNPA